MALIGTYRFGGLLADSSPFQGDRGVSPLGQPQSGGGEKGYAPQKKDSRLAVLFLWSIGDSNP